MRIAPASRFSDDGPVDLVGTGHPAIIYSCRRQHTIVEEILVQMVGKTKPELSVLIPELVVQISRCIQTTCAGQIYVKLVPPVKRFSTVPYNKLEGFPEFLDMPHRCSNHRWQ